VLVNDSQVTVGATAKGRSSSKQINKLFLSVLPYLVSFGLTLHLIWISTHINPADYPSRRKPLPPRSELPSWAKGLWRREAVPGMSSRKLRHWANRGLTRFSGGVQGVFFGEFKFDTASRQAWFDLRHF